MKKLILNKFDHITINFGETRKNEAGKIHSSFTFLNKIPRKIKFSDNFVETRTKFKAHVPHLLEQIPRSSLCQNLRIHGQRSACEAMTLVTVTAYLHNGVGFPETPKLESTKHERTSLNLSGVVEFGVRK